MITAETAKQMVTRTLESLNAAGGEIATVGDALAAVRLAQAARVKAAFTGLFADLSLTELAVVVQALTPSPAPSVSTTPSPEPAIQPAASTAASTPNPPVPQASLFGRKRRK